MTDPLCTARHYSTKASPDCRCEEYRKVRQDERRRMRKATPTRQGRMTPEQKARVAAAHDFLIFVTSDIDSEGKK